MINCLVFYVTVTTGFMWDSATPDALTRHVCAGHEIDLPWNFSLAHEERVEDIQWMYSAPGRDSEDIAVLTAGHFLVMPAFAGRVVRRGEAGIAITWSTMRESGNYSVLVSVSTGNILSRYQRATWVQINNLPRTDSGMLHVELSSSPVYDSSTSSWNLLLTCGHFTDLGYPPVGVVWRFPDGHVVYSSYVNNSDFSLLIGNQRSSGNYTCRINESAAFQCLPESSLLRQETSVVVDRVEVSLLLLQSAVATLKEDNEQLRNNLTAVKVDNEHLRNNLTAVKVDNEQFRGDLTALKNNGSWGAVLQIGFHATLPAGTTVATGATLAPWTNRTNYGNGFNPVSGIFVAPVSGLYLFIASTGPDHTDVYANLRLMADGYSDGGLSETWLKQYSGYWNMGSVHAVLHLARGQRVWLTCHDKTSYFDSERTSFSGILIGAD